MSDKYTLANLNNLLFMLGKHSYKESQLSTRALLSSRIHQFSVHNLNTLETSPYGHLSKMFVISNTSLGLCGDM